MHLRTSIWLFLLFSLITGSGYAQGCYNLFMPPEGNITTSSITLTWEDAPITSDGGYVIFYTPQGGTELSTPLVYSPFTLTGLTAGTQYTIYVMEPSGQCNISQPAPALSSSITISTKSLAPASPVAGTIGSTSFVSSWTAATGATRYYLDVSTSNTFASFVAGYNNLDVGNTTNHLVTGLNPGTQYYFRVRANNTGGSSANSTTAGVLLLPASPTASAASSIAQTGFTANWNAVTSATGYFLDVSTSNAFDSFVSGYNNRSVGDVTSFAVTGLTPGRSYYYRVRAANASGPSDHSSVIELITVPGTPSSTISNVTTTGFTANWSSIIGASDYYIDVSLSNTFAGFVGVYNNLDVDNVSTINITGLTAGTTYYFRIRSGNISGSSPSSSTTTVLTLPAAPGASAATGITQSGFTANWSAVTSAASYRLDVSTSNTFSSFVSGYSDLNVNNVTGYAVTGLTAGTTYYYRVRAVNASGTSGHSGTVTVLTVPPTPVAAAGTAITQTSFTANWAAASSATGYRVDVSLASDFSSFVVNNADAGNVTSYNVSSLTAGTTYYYRIRAYNASGVSVSSSTISVLTIPPAPAATAASAVSASGFMANWSAATSATGYRLDVSASNTFATFVTGYNDLNVNNVTSYAVTGLAAGTTYYYRVRSYNASGVSGQSSTITVITIPPAPVLTTTTSITATGFTVNWSASTSATGYRLDVSTSNTFATFVAGYNDLNVNNVTSYAITGLTEGTTYYYRVRAYNAYGTSSHSTMGTVITVPATPVLAAATAITQTGFTINWNTVTAATGYRVDVSAVNDFSSMIVNNVDVGNNTSHNVSSLNAGATYYYRVRAYNASGTSASSLTGSIVTIPPAPVATSFTSVSQSGFTVNWNAATSATGYRLDVSTADTFASFVLNNQSIGNVTSYDVTGLNPGTTYYIRLRTVNSSGTSGNSNVLSTITAPPVPTSLTASSVTMSGFTAGWSASTGATQYFLDVSTVNTFATFVAGYNNLNVNNVTSFAVTGLSAGTTYYFRVRSSNASGVSASSSTASVVTVPASPAITSASAITQTGFTANWNSTAAATGYRLDISTSNTFSSFVSGYNDLNVNAVTSYAVTGLTAGTTYYYRVRAYNANGTSASSSAASVITVPPTPVVSAGTAITQTSFTANWTTASAATGYRVDVSLASDFSSFVVNNADAGNVTSYNVSSLTAGTTYYYRIRAYNASGTSVSSTTISVLTVPAAPIAAAASAVSASGFTANWSAATSATGYRLDVSVSNTFATFVTGYNDLNVNNVTSYAVTGLTAGTTYYYRVRSYNSSGTSGASTTINVLTIPAAPLALGPANITATGFTAAWNSTTGATGYRLDVSAQSDFSTFLPGLQNLDAGNTTQQIITGLSSGVSYYYRVSAYNASGNSAESNTAWVLTRLAAPANLQTSSLQATGFTITWDMPGALEGFQGYRLDLSTDVNFTTFVTGYENLDIGNIAERTYAMTDLLPGTVYYFRLRAVNTTGASENSATGTALTRPSAPVLLAPSNITQSGFTINWNSVTGGVTSYWVDVSTSADFSSYVSGYSNKNVSLVTSTNITGLTPGTEYFYRVRSQNASGLSDHSLVQAVSTTPPAPAAITVVSVLQASIGLEWPAVTGVTGYRLDVSTDNAFTQMLPGYTNLAVATATHNVTGLTAGTVYYFRVRSQNANGVSDHSPVTSQVTIPGNTTLTSGNVPQKSETSFELSWSAVPGAEYYEVVVMNLAAGKAPLANYNPYNTTELQMAAVLLQAGGSYAVKMRAGNSAGVSSYSNEVNVFLPGNTQQLANLVVNFDEESTFASGTLGLQVSYSGAGIGTITREFCYRPVTSTEAYTCMQVTSNEITTTPEMFDELGMEFIVKVYDQAGQELVSQRKQVLRSYPEATIPVTAFGGALKDYRIISSPYQLSNNDRIENLLEPVLGKYNPARWRFYAWDGGKYKEYNEGVSKTSMQRGKGYFINTVRDIQQVPLTEATAPVNFKDAPFAMNLQQGWNLIGNPYPFDIQWQDILDANPSVTGVSALRTFNADGTGYFSDSDVLRVAEGGFVFANQATTLTIPVTIRQVSAGGRKGKQDDRYLNQFSDPASWFVSVAIQNETIENNLGGLGMHPLASDELDGLDEATLPRFVNYFDWTTKPAQSSVPRLTRDVVPVRSQYSWYFQIESNVGSELTTIRWSSETWDNIGGQLLLHDLGNNAILSMQQFREYTFRGESRSFAVYYSSTSEALTDKITLGVPFPNPASDQLFIPIGFNTTLNSLKSLVTVQDMTGRVVAEFAHETEQEGLQTITWDLSHGGRKLQPGVYIITVQTQMTEGKTVVRSRIVVR